VRRAAAVQRAATTTTQAGGGALAARAVVSTVGPAECRVDGWRSGLGGSEPSACARGGAPVHGVPGLPAARSATVAVMHSVVRALCSTQQTSAMGLPRG